MANLNPVTIGAAGTAVAYSAASAGGDTVTNADVDTVLVVRNASAAPITVTLAGAVPCSQGALHPKAFPCPVGDTEIPVPPQAIAADKTVAVTYSATATVTVAAVRH